MSSCVAIPTLQAYRTLRRLVEALLRDPEVGAVVILDNGHRRPNARNWMRQAARDERVHVVDARGWGIHRMWNWGRHWALEHGHELYGAYNDDLEVPEAVTGLLAAALRADPSLWVVSPDWHRRLAEGLDPGAVRYVSGTQRHGGIAGWCWLGRTELLPDVDEAFEWWYGDDDLARQVDLAGGRLGVLAGVPLDHDQETTARHHPWTRDAIVRDGRRYEAKYGPGSAIPTRVSVLMPTLGRPDRLRRALGLVLAQGYPDFEVVVQNGGDRLDPAAVPELEDERVRLAEQPDGGIGPALNLAAERATGDVWHVAMDDDEMQPGALWSAASALRTGSSEWTYGWMRTFQETPSGRRQEVQRRCAGPWPWNLDEHKAANSINQPTAFFTRASYEKLGPFHEAFPMVWDYEWWMRLGTRWEPAARDHCDAHYVIWPGSTSVKARGAMALEVARLQALWAEKGYGER